LSTFSPWARSVARNLEFAERFACLQAYLQSGRDFRPILR
jgi:hypothetical protein